MSLIPRLFPEEPAQAATPRPAQQIARGTTQARYHHFALAVDILSEIAQGTVPADQVLYHHFRKLPQMGARDRGIVAESVYGVLRQRRSLAWRMGVG
ncbi:MAG: hypothetical protein PHF20_05100, partial [Halothiobacillaceae bacterium]|nr:hypothetical protein [Halothiobacillaceae bacterium]